MIQSGRSEDFDYGVYRRRDEIFNTLLISLQSSRMQELQAIRLYLTAVMIASNPGGVEAPSFVQEATGFSVSGALLLACAPPQIPTLRAFSMWWRLLGSTSDHIYAFLCKYYHNEKDIFGRADAASEYCPLCNWQCLLRCSCWIPCRLYCLQVLIP